MQFKKKSFILFFLLCLALDGHAQDSPMVQWQEGRVVLKNGRTLQGILNINFFQQNIRLVAKGDTTEQSFSPAMVNEFSLKKHDSEERFLSLNLGDGIKLYRWMGETENVAFLFYVEKSSLEELVISHNQSDDVVSLISKNPKVTSDLLSKGQLKGYFGYLIALTPKGRQIVFAVRGEEMLSSSNRSYISRKSGQIKFLTQFDPDIKEYMKEKKLSFKKNLAAIISRVIEVDSK